MAEDVTWREWDLSGLTVDQLRFDSQVTVLVQEGLRRSLFLMFGSPFEYRPPTGVAVPIDSQSVTTEQAGLLVGLLWRPAKLFRVSSTGYCELHIDNGVVIAARPDADYESWHSSGTGDLESASMLCTPGGGTPWGTRAA
jgi:hypothetical protein